MDACEGPKKSFVKHLFFTVGRDSSVGIAARYGPDGAGIENM
jgi:hypothetical protein